MRKRAMTWAVFDRRFEVLDADDSGQSCEYEEAMTLADGDVHRLWAIVDGENGQSYIIPGFHVVNVFGWMATKKPWCEGTEDEHIYVLW